MSQLQPSVASFVRAERMAFATHWLAVADELHKILKMLSFLTWQ